MKATYRALILTIISFVYTLEFTQADLKYENQEVGNSFVLHHTKSNKYVALFNGTSGSHAGLTSFPQYAQPFKILKNDDGTVSFVTEDGLAVLDKTLGCDLENADVGYYTTISGLINQLFTINNFGTIGSKCCDTCLIVPNSDYTYLIVQNYTCLYETNEDWKFTISLNTLSEPLDRINQNV